MPGGHRRRVFGLPLRKQVLAGLGLSVDGKRRAAAAAELKGARSDVCRRWRLLRSGAFPVK